MQPIKLFEQYSKQDIDYASNGYESVRGKYYPRTPGDAWRQLYIDDLYALGFTSKDPAIKHRKSTYGGVTTEYTYNGHGHINFFHPHYEDLTVQFENGSFRVLVRFYDQDKKDSKYFWGYTYHDFNKLMGKLGVNLKVRRVVNRDAAAFFNIMTTSDVVIK